MVLQSETVIRKWDGKRLSKIIQVYYKVHKVLQSVTEIYYNNCHVLQSATDCYYKVHQVLQSVTGCYYKVRVRYYRVWAITKWDVTPDKIIIKPAMTTFQVTSKILYISVLSRAAGNATYLFKTLTGTVSLRVWLINQLKRINEYSHLGYLQ